MTITSEEELERLKVIGRICAIARDTMAGALEPGMTTKELDDIGRKVLDDHGARSAPAELVITIEEVNELSEGM